MLRFRTTATVLVLLAAALFPGLCPYALASADEAFNITPTITAREGYDSNVYFQGKGDMEHRLAPGLKFDVQQERLRGYLSATGTAYKYTLLNDFDRFDQKYDAFIEANATERLSATLTSSAIMDHTFSSTLENTGEIAKMVVRRVLSVSPSASYYVTERNQATLFGSISKTTYGSKLYTDSTSRTLGGRWGYQLSERTQAILQTSHVNTVQENAYQNILSNMAGFDYALTETLKTRLLGGISSLSSSDASGKKTSSRGFSADASLQWTGEKSGATANFARDMTSGLAGEDIVRTRFALSLTNRFTERVQLQFNSNVVQSQTTGTTTTQTTRWMEANPLVQYQTTEHSTIALGYGYGMQQVVETKEVKSRNQVFLNFTISFP